MLLYPLKIVIVSFLLFISFANVSLIMLVQKTIASTSKMMNNNKSSIFVIYFNLLCYTYKYSFCVQERNERTTNTKFYFVAAAFLLYLSFSLSPYIFFFTHFFFILVYYRADNFSAVSAVVLYYSLLKIYRAHR